MFFQTSKNRPAQCILAEAEGELSEREGHWPLSQLLELYIESTNHQKVSEGNGFQPILHDR